MDGAKAAETRETFDNQERPQASTSSNVGLSDAQLSQPRRRMLDLVNRLHSTGVQVDIDLPQIAVIGSQSVGKSSLIEAISGITLPRAAGTCTRCPTECRLTHSDGPWQCKVSLRFITDKKGQLLGQVRNEPFGPTIFNKSEVEERIRRAQRAILNPSRPRKDFLGGPDEDDGPSELTFSSNCVSLQISGPDVADLSFCDLPGLIASVSSSGGQTNDISLVEGLVTSYIKKPSCIILLTVTCETDFENQGAHRLAKYHDPEGKRTIGVLTKPDRIPEGEHAQWLPFIQNEKEPLDNNWYCVKQPSSSDIKKNITYEQARKSEDDYFAFTAPWNELDPVYLKYLRTKNLVDRLSSVLSDLIAKRLPEIQDEIDRAMLRAREVLHSLPKPPSADPVNEVASLLYNFAADLSRHIEGVPGEKGLLQKIRPAQERFRRAIMDTAPHFIPFERDRAGSMTLEPPGFLGGDEDPMGDVGEESSRSKKRRTAGGHQQHNPNAERKIYVDEVLARAHKARTRELPGNYPFAVQKTFIVDIVKQWKKPALEYLQAVQNLMLAHTRDLINQHFAEFGQGILEAKVRSIVQHHLNECYTRAEERVLYDLTKEESPFTINYHYLSDYKSKFIAYYKSARDRQVRGSFAAQIEAYNEGGKGVSGYSPQPPPAAAPAPASVPAPAPPAPAPAPAPATSAPTTAPAPGAPAFTSAFGHFGTNAFGVPASTPKSTGAFAFPPAKTSFTPAKEVPGPFKSTNNAFGASSSALGGFASFGGGSSTTLGLFGSSQGTTASQAQPKAATTATSNGTNAQPKLDLPAPAPAPVSTPTPAAATTTRTTSSSDNPAVQAGIMKVLSGLTEMGIVGIKPEDLYRILPPDEMEPAIEIMASVRAYFQVAFKRFADNVPQSVDYELVKGVERDILKTLCTKLGTNGPNSQKNCAELAQESAQIADRRQDVMKKLERLQSAGVELMEIGLS